MILFESNSLIFIIKYYYYFYNAYINTYTHQCIEGFSSLYIYIYTFNNQVDHD